MSGLSFDIYIAKSVGIEIFKTFKNQMNND